MKNVYEAPEVEVIEMAVENGIAQSGGGFNVGLDDDNWDGYTQY